MKNLLNHEQGHFNIAVLAAKKLKKLAGKVDFTTPNIEVPRLEAAKKRIDDESGQMNDKYEGETRNGRNKEDQARWDKYIHDELAKLTNENIRIFFK